MTSGLVVGMTLVKSAPASVPMLVADNLLTRGGVVADFTGSISGSRLDPF